MLGLIRVTMLLALILVLGMAAVIGAPKRSPSDGAGRGRSNWSWRPFATNGGTYKTPQGWNVYDAFTTTTAHDALTCSEPICPLTSHVAYFRRATGRAELFAIYGKDGDMESLLFATWQTLNSAAALRGKEQGMVHFADGTDGKYVVTRMKLGSSAEITFFVATREDAGASLLLSGGARSGDFELSEFLALARKIHSPAVEG
jgi:hypothetical protein